MASLSSLSTLPITTTSLSSRTRWPLFSKTSSHRFNVSCNASADENPNIILPKSSLTMPNVDRRNLLLGLGGLYGAAANVGSALADLTVTAPDDIHGNCVDATVGVRDPANALRGVACCAPAPTENTKPDEYVLPEFTDLRIRPSAHRLTPEYIAKYQAAIAAMKALGDDDPRSWKNQGKIHCAYCNGAYTIDNAIIPQDNILQVHNSWLFFPFHRWYLYFYERILGDLIGDPTFGLPYWNWDNPSGMMLPAIFEAPYGDPNPNPRVNPLFDPYRNVEHLPPSILDLQYRPGGPANTCIDQININLSTMYEQMISTTQGNPAAFFGTDPIIRPGHKVMGGAIEAGAHTAMHIWTGNPRMTNNEDMGNFYSAGYDPIFYCHHSNVDRMWKVWNDLDPSNTDLADQDWLNSSFVFYDKDLRLVRVYVRDCLDINKMGYDFQASRIPWALSRPVARVKASNVAAESIGVVSKAEELKFPVKLDQTLKVLVKRPVTKRSDDEKKKANEMLFLNGIKFNSEQFFKVDVLVNDVDDGIETTAASSEFAGTFAQVPHKHGHEMFMTSGAVFGITHLLEDIEAENDEYVLVTLIPRAGAEDATISGIEIELVPIGN